MHLVAESDDCKRAKGRTGVGRVSALRYLVRTSDPSALGEKRHTIQSVALLASGKDSLSQSPSAMRQESVLKRADVAHGRM